MLNSAENEICSTYKQEVPEDLYRSTGMHTYDL